MNDAEYEAQKVRVQSIADRWIRPIGLGWWSIMLKWSREPGKEHHDGEMATAFTCHSDWRYAIATITCHVPEMPSFDDDDLEGMFVHELMHIFLGEMRVQDSGEAEHQAAHEERVATTLARGFMWMRDALKEETERGRETIAEHTAGQEAERE